MTEILGRTIDGGINAQPLFHYDDVIDYLISIDYDTDLIDYFIDNKIYQIYTVEFINEISSVIDHVVGNKPKPVVIEVMCGDGLLSRHLTESTRYSVIPTDDMSNGKWYSGREYGIVYPETVIQIEAEYAVERYNPDVVIMSWEPYGSLSSENIVHNLNTPLIWIGDKDFCGCSHRMWEFLSHEKMNNQFSIARGRTIKQVKNRSDIYLFDV